MEEQKHNTDGVNLNIQRTDMHQFTGMARVQMFTETVMSVLRMIVAVLVVGGIVGLIGFIGFGIYMDNQSQVKPATQKSSKVQQAKPAPQAAPQKPAVDLSAWRQVVKGMNHEQVRNLLGEPSRIQGGSFTFWNYSSGGAVTFYEGKVYSWNEPQ